MRYIEWAKEYALNFDCDSVNLSRGDYEIEIELCLTERQFNRLLKHIGKEKCMEYFGLVEKSPEKEGE